MNLRNLVFLGLLALVAGCGSDPAGEPAPTEFDGDWIVVSTIVQKTLCSGGEPNDVDVDEVTITQDGLQVTLDFGDYLATGSVLDGVLVAQGELPTEQAVTLTFTREGAELRGSLDVDGSGCMESRTLSATRRIPDADFSGHWRFQLTVVGEGGCTEITDYDDCFRILQSGRDLLVVDEEAGNLFGTVTGNIAEIQRDTQTESTFLIFYLDPTGPSLTGTASRSYKTEGCRSELVFTGAPNPTPCASGKH